jgi:hypothetical protein
MPVGHSCAFVIIRGRAGYSKHAKRVMHICRQGQACAVSCATCGTAFELAVDSAVERCSQFCKPMRSIRGVAAHDWSRPLAH